MGILDRDYYRDDNRGVFGTWGRRSVTAWLIIVTCVVWVAQLVTSNGGSGLVTVTGEYNPRHILSGEVWRLFTAVFLHAETTPWHIAFNMFVLYWTGTRLEARYGGHEFLAFYLVGGVFANVVYLMAYVFGFAPSSPALGASGAVTAALVLFAFNYPRHQVLVFFIVPMPIWLIVMVYVGLDVLGASGGRVNNQPVAYVVHLGGALFGVIYYKLGLRFLSLVPNTPAVRRPRATQLRVVPRDAELHENPATVESPVAAAVQDASRSNSEGEEPFETRVDRVLEKVSQHGQESLSADERDLLFRASELYKRRRK